MDIRASDIKLRQLQYFLAVADNLHFTNAATQLAVTQPTLSHQIRELEHRLGCQLFDRIGRSVRLTQAGALLRTYATRSISQLDAGRAAIAELEGLVRGNLKIGVIQSFSRTLFPPLLGRFISKYPSIRVQVDEMTAPEIEAALTAGRLDLGIAFAPSLDPETELEPVLDERLLLVVPAAHPFARKRFVRMRDLDKQRMALLNSSYSTRHLIDGYLQKAGADPNVICETNSMQIMLGAVTRSGLVTIIPERAITSRRRSDIRILPLRDPTPMRTSALMWPRDAFRTRAARTFGEMVRDRFLRPGLPATGQHDPA
jgi:LysR family transcriptional regulator, cyn operon transcriptional activator